MGSRKIPPAASADAPLPSSRVRSLISIWLVVHLFFAALSLSAVAAASVLQMRLLSVAAIYQVPLHLAVEGRPIYMTHGEPGDQTHRIQWLREAGAEWETEAVHGYRGSERQRRYSRLAKAIAGAAEREETAVASLLALPVVHAEFARAAEAGAAPPTRMRIVRLAPDLRVVRYPALPVETPRWEAAIVRQGDAPQGDSRRTAPQLALVTIKERRLNAVAEADAGSPAAPSPDGEEGH